MLLKKDIEVEVKSFISSEKYDKLKAFFEREAEFLYEDIQDTFYFTGEDDLRIQKNNFNSKIVLKSGKVHDEQRREVELHFSKDDFEKSEDLFNLLGFNVEIKWFRKRLAYKWEEIEVCLDFTKGYGHILEMEILSDESDCDENLLKLKEKFAELEIDVTSREEFDEQFKNYKENWRELIRD